jgi:hypothetical protein
MNQVEAPSLIRPKYGPGGHTIHRSCINNLQLVVAVYVPIEKKGKYMNGYQFVKILIPKVLKSYQKYAKNKLPVQNLRQEVFRYFINFYTLSCRILTKKIRKILRQPKFCLLTRNK